MKFIKLIKFKHFIKNLLIFIPFILPNNYSNNFYLDEKTIILFLASFFFLCFISQSVYMFNDYIDQDKDSGFKNNLYNKFNGSKILYFSIAIFFLITPYLISVTNGEFFKIMELINIYLILNLAYTLLVKRYLIFGVAILSSFFVIRLLIGISILDLELSSFIQQIVLIFFTGMYVGLAKRHLYKRINPNLFQENIKKIKNLVKYFFYSTVIIMLYFLFNNNNLSSFVFHNEFLIIKRVLLSINFLIAINLFNIQIKKNKRSAEYMDIILEKKIFILTLMFILIYIL